MCVRQGHTPHSSLFSDTTGITNLMVYPYLPFFGTHTTFSNNLN